MSTAKLYFSRNLNPRLAVATARFLKSPVEFEFASPFSPGQRERFLKLIGKHVTYADFRVACVLPFAGLAGLPLADFRRVEAWHARLMDIPAWRDPFTGLDVPELPPIRKGAG